MLLQIPQSNRTETQAKAVFTRLRHLPSITMHITLPTIVLYFLTLFALANAVPGTTPNPALVKRTNPKANEYRSDDW